MHLRRPILFLTLYSILANVISDSEHKTRSPEAITTERQKISSSFLKFGGSTKGLFGVENVHDNVFSSLIPPEYLQTTNLSESERNAILTSFTRKSVNNNRILQLEKVGFSSSSTFYVQKNRTLPDNLLTSFSNRTELLPVDIFHDVQNSWTLMNSKTADGTNATQPNADNPHHLDTFVPPAGWWGAPFYWPLTIGIYISTDHYEAPWKSSFAGNFSFSEGKQLGSFFQLDGTYAYYESVNYSTIQIPLTIGKQVLHLVLPNINIVDFYIEESGGYVNKTRNPSVTDPSQHSRRVQLPALDISSWTTEYYIADPGLVDLKRIVCRKTKYCLGSLPRTQYLKFRPDSFEVSSATGTTVQDQGLQPDSTSWINPKSKSSPLRENAEESSTQRKLPKRVTASDFDVQGITVSTTQHDILRFDKPFAWYLTNEGEEIYSGIVNPSRTFYTRPGEEEWVSYDKILLWTGRHPTILN